MLGDCLGPRLYVEPVGQGDSDKRLIGFGRGR
jgi:hypothetical protein